MAAAPLCRVPAVESRLVQGFAEGSRMRELHAASGRCVKLFFLHIHKTAASSMQLALEGMIRSVNGTILQTDPKEGPVNSLLEQLASATGDVLEGDGVINALSTIKAEAAELEASLAQTAAALAAVRAASDEYVARAGARRGPRG